MGNGTVYELYTSVCFQSGCCLFSFFSVTGMDYEVLLYTLLRAAASNALSVMVQLHNGAVVCCLAVAGSCSYDSCEWISSAWLLKWMSADKESDIPPIDNSQLCCQHERYVA